MMPGMRNPSMMTSMVPGQNMVLVNALDKNKTNGLTGGSSGMGAHTSVFPPLNSSINNNNSMTTINSSLQSSGGGGVLIGGHPPGQMKMAPMNLLGDMNNTMVSMHSQQQGMQQQIRPIKGQQTIIPSHLGMPNRPMVRHVNQMGGPMQRGGGQLSMLGGQLRMLPGPGVRMQNMPDMLNSSFDGDNNANNSNVTISNVSVDQIGPPKQMGGGGVGMMPGIRNRGMVTSMASGQNMVLVNSLKKNTTNGPTRGSGGMGAHTSVFPPHNSSINNNNSMTTINSSLQSSSGGGVLIIGHPPGQMKMAPMNLSGDTNNTMVSMHSQQQGMQQQIRPIMGQQTIIPSHPGIPNRLKVRHGHVNQMGGPMQPGGSRLGMLDGQLRMPSPSVRMQNMPNLVNTQLQSSGQMNMGPGSVPVYSEPNNVGNPNLPSNSGPIGPAGPIGQQPEKKKRIQICLTCQLRKVKSTGHTFSPKYGWSCPSEKGCLRNSCFIRFLFNYYFIEIGRKLPFLQFFF